MSESYILHICMFLGPVHCLQTVAAAAVFMPPPVLHASVLYRPLAVALYHVWGHLCPVIPAMAVVSVSSRLHHQKQLHGVQ